MSVRVWKMHCIGLDHHRDYNYKDARRLVPSQGLDKSIVRTDQDQLCVNVNYLKKSTYC